MKKQLCLFLILIESVFTFSSSQTFVYEFGQISPGDVELNSCTYDDNADAVVIYDIGSSCFLNNDYNFSLNFERSTRLKVLKESGVKWANVEVPLYQDGDDMEEIYDIKASTYNFENGRLVKTDLDLSQSHVEKINEYWSLKKFALPNVKVGSIIEFTYAIKSHLLFHFRSWDFQWKIPVLYSKYVAKMIPFYEYTYLLQGTTSFDEQRSYENNAGCQYGAMTYNEMVYEFGKKNIPAFNDEKYISSIKDYIMKIDFQLSKIHRRDGSSQNIITTWPELIKELLSNYDFGVYLKKAERLASTMISVNDTLGKTPQGKFDFVINYMKNNLRYNNIDGQFSTKSPKDLIKNKSGSSADINLFAIAMLRACRIQANPLLLSTREHGKIKYDYPFSHFFNYVAIVANVEDKRVVSDATNPLLLNNRIPEECINDKGLVVKKDGVEWLRLETTVPSKVQVVIEQDITETGLKATIESSATEYEAYDFRSHLGSDKSAIEIKLKKEGYNVVDSTLNLKNNTNITSPVSLKFAIAEKPEKINDKIYVSPFLREGITDNPLKQKNRLYPIDMVYPVNKSYFSQISIPKGYKVSFIPENTIITDDNGFDLNYVVNHDENKILISFNYYFKKSVYNADEYENVKKYFKEIIRKIGEKVVIEKI
jgi:hypothetical protein